MANYCLLLVPVLGLLTFHHITVDGQSDVCKENELCVSEQRCNETDDSGRGKIGPRIGVTCGKGQVCCERVQLESWDASLSSRASNENKPNPTNTSVYESCGVNKECVPRQLCNGTINDNGRFLIGPRIADKAAKIDVRLDDDVCRPLQHCCDVGDQFDASENPFLADLRDFKARGCGYSNPKGVIVDLNGFGEDVSLFGEFPWMVALFSGRNVYLCGGTLIHPSLVLTSAHNIVNQTIDTLVARAGDWILNSFDEPHAHQSQRIKQIIRHENFDNEAFFNDIALLVMAEPFELAPHIQPLCLPPPETPQLLAQLRAAQCYATGWGGRTLYSEHNENFLKRIALPVVSREECTAKLRLTRLGRRFRLRPSFICAGGEMGRDTCRGDGGSPLFCTLPGSTDRYVMAGLVSWGVDCQEQDIPAVYANVPYLREWIDGKVKELGLKLDAP